MIHKKIKTAIVDSMTTARLFCAAAKEACCVKTLGSTCPDFTKRIALQSLLHLEAFMPENMPFLRGRDHRLAVLKDFYLDNKTQMEKVIDKNVQVLLSHWASERKSENAGTVILNAIDGFGYDLTESQQRALAHNHIEMICLIDRSVIPQIADPASLPGAVCHSLNFKKGARRFALGAASLILKAADVMTHEHPVFAKSWVQTMAKVPERDRPKMRAVYDYCADFLGGIHEISRAERHPLRYGLGA